MERSLLQRIKSFLDESGMPSTAFGRAAVHDPRFVSDLRGGRVPGDKVTARAEHFMNKWRADRDARRAGRSRASGSGMAVRNEEGAS